MRGKKKIDKLKRKNGTGGIRKHGGNRRKPYQAFITKEYILDNKTLKVKKKEQSIGFCSTYEEALCLLNKYLKDPWDINKDGLTFKEVYKLWSERYFKTLQSKSNIRAIVSAFNHSVVLHDRIFASITIINLRDTIENYGISPSMKSRMKSTYNLMWDFAVEAQITSVNIARNFTIKNLQKDIDRKRVSKKPFSDADEKLLWDNIDFGFTRMILIGIYSGLRPQELVLLKNNNINLKENYMIAGMKTDAGTDRYIPIHHKIKKLIEYYYNNKNEFLFNDINEFGHATPLTYDKYRGRFRKVMNFLNLSGYSPHCTRHTFITKSKKYNLDEYAIKIIVGHEVYDVTEKFYTHRNKKWLHEQIALIA